MANPATQTRQIPQADGRAQADGRWQMAEMAHQLEQGEKRRKGSLPTYRIQVQGEKNIPLIARMLEYRAWVDGFGLNSSRMDSPSRWNRVGQGGFRRARNGRRQTLVLRSFWQFRGNWIRAIISKRRSLNADELRNEATDRVEKGRFG